MRDVRTVARSYLGRTNRSSRNSIANFTMSVDQHENIINTNDTQKHLEFSENDTGILWRDKEIALLRTFVADQIPLKSDIFEKLTAIALPSEQRTGSLAEKYDPESGLDLGRHSPLDEVDEWYESGQRALSFPYVRSFNEFEDRTRNRRFFMSEKKGIGLAPADSQPGDLICILFGRCLPVILRQIEGHYIYIGETYFHEWMDGEAIKLLKAGELSEQNFEIR